MTRWSGRLGLLLVLGFALAVAISPGAAAAELDAPVAEVVRVRGIAAVSRDGVGRQLAAGDRLYRFDTVATGRGGRLQIRFIDGTVLSLGEGSGLRLAEYAVDVAEGVRAVHLQALSGIFRAVVAQVSGPSQYEIELMFSVASVRSTVLLFEVDPAQGCSVFVAEGAVAVRHKNPVLAPADVAVTDGLGTTITEETPPAPPKPWKPERIAAFYARTAVD